MMIRPHKMPEFLGPNSPFHHLLAIILLLYTMFLCTPLHAMVLRLHARALADLGSLASDWMHDAVARQQLLPASSRHQIAHRLGNGRLQLHNLTAARFSAPRVQLRPRGAGNMLYMATDGGNAELDAQWSLQSDLLLSLVRSPAFSGSVHTRIRAFNADVSIKVVDRNKLAMHQCIARFEDFQLQLGGSLAADLIHWFHRPLAQALQSHVEQAYCDMIGDKLLPWLREQFTHLALRLHMDFGPDLRLAQWLHAVRPGDAHVDLALGQRLLLINSRKGSGRKMAGGGTVLAELLPADSGDYDLPAAEGNSTSSNLTEDARHLHSVSLLLSERTLQQVFSGAHHSRHFWANFSGPFLRTSCPFLCLGTIVPQMRSALGPAHLLAVVRTNSAPVVRLSRHRIALRLNGSFELYQQHRRVVDEADVEEDEELGETMTMDDPDHVQNRIRDQNQINDQVENEVLEDDEELPLAEDDGTAVALDEFADLEEDGMDQPEQVEELENDVEGTMIRPKLIGVPHSVPQPRADIVTATFRPSTTLTTMPRATTKSHLPLAPPVATPAAAAPAGVPVVHVVLDTELELLLVLDARQRRLRTELNVRRTRALLARSQISGLSQKTMDLMLDASVPFLENAVRIFYRDGLELDDLFHHLPTRNESVRIEPGHIRLDADLNLAKLLSH